MERLTIRNSDGTVSQPTKTTVEDVFYRLAAYEDTGLEPDELEEMRNDAYDLGYQSCLNYKGLKWTEAEELQRYREIGVSRDRLRELAQADKEGRPHLPCEPGDKIYRVVRWGKGKVAIKERIVSSVEYNATGEWVLHSAGDDVLGKKCFLTREEAENALKSGADNAVT